VRDDARRRGVTISTQTRDMNPVYTGKDVSYIDTKQAQRSAETAVLDAERAAALASLLGASYPHEVLDKAWRLLVYGAHHDAITGTESDQVYLDLVAGWREATDLGREVLAGAVGHLAAQAGTRADTTVDAGTAVFALNTLSWTRDGLTTVTIRYPEPGRRGVRVTDPDGTDVPAVTEAVRRHPDETLAEITLSFSARRMPALGYRVYQVVDADTVPASWIRRPGPRLSRMRRSSWRPTRPGAARCAGCATFARTGRWYVTAGSRASWSCSASIRSTRYGRKAPGTFFRRVPERAPAHAPPSATWRSARSDSGSSAR